MLPAHLTLFHKLPGERRGVVEWALAHEAECDRPPLEFVGLRGLGGGVAYDVASPALHRVRAALRERFGFSLTAQDQAGFRAHVTVQNKVAAAAARALHQQLSSGFAAWTGFGEALLLWRYDGGPWSLLSEWRFASARATSHTSNATSASA